MYGMFSIHPKHEYNGYYIEIDMHAFNERVHPWGQVELFENKMQWNPLLEVSAIMGIMTLLDLDNRSTYFYLPTI